MIRINRPTNAPTHLTKKGALQKGKDCTAYDVCPSDYCSGKQKFEGKRSIYASKQVKRVLSTAHHNKCCYCEKKIRAPIDLAVEHFRPKTKVRQSKKQKEEWPGYYWLAHEWENLLLSCGDCNSTHKQILFPLANPKHRARSHHDNISVERPLLVNPAAQDPRDHIRFRGEDPEPRTRIGRVTISVLGLRRAPLREDRLEKLNIIKTYWDTTRLAAKLPKNRSLHRLANRFRKFLREAILPESEFSSMAQDFLSCRPI